MKKAVILCVAIVTFVLLIPVALSAQEDESVTEKITVKNKEVNNGVVILSVQGMKSPFELQCNKGATGCTLLDTGEYIMVRLPKNRGLYDCANAEVYRKAEDTQTGNKVGQYCLLETK